ncbi:TetR/AcrR family transcriptional regulator [Mycolicibacterium sp. XJ662]
MTETDITVQKPEIPERILVAAARVMEREGFANASLRQIAEEAGMTKAGLYYHVASKEVLLFALHDRFATRLRDYSERITAADLSPTEKLRELIKQTVETAAVYKSEGTVFLREYSHLTGEMAATVFAQRDHFRSMFEAVIDDGVAAGEFRPGKTGLDALAILGACNFTAFWFDPEGTASIDEIAEEFVDRLVYGMSAGDNDKGGRS